LALLLVFGVFPKLLTDRIDPTAQAVVEHVAPDHTTDVGETAVVQANGTEP
jgi:NADH:ubiquinone oxidoreductase subunit 4 (subunit M)